MASLRYVSYKFLKGMTLSPEVEDLFRGVHLSPDEFLTLSSLAKEGKAFESITGSYVVGKPTRGTYFETELIVKRGETLTEWFTFDSYGFKYLLWHHKVGFCENGAKTPVTPETILLDGQGNLSISEDWICDSMEVITANCFREAQKEATLSWILHQLADYVDKGVGELRVDEEFKRGVKLVTRSSKRMIESGGTAGSTSETHS